MRGHPVSGTPGDWFRRASPYLTDMGIRCILDALTQSKGAHTR